MCASPIRTWLHDSDVRKRLKKRGDPFGIDGLHPLLPRHTAVRVPRPCVLRGACMKWERETPTRRPARVDFDGGTGVRSRMGGVKRAQVVGLALATVLIGWDESSAATRKYRSCEQLSAVYPYGVGRKGAIDKAPAGQRSPAFMVNSALYAKLPKTLDRDRDGIACEGPTPPVAATTSTKTTTTSLVVVQLVSVPQQPAVTTPEPITTPAPAPTAPAITPAPLPVVVARLARRFANCSELNAAYPHGVGRSGAQ